MADIAVDVSIATGTARAGRTLVYTTDQIGYWFFIDGDGVFGYRKTTDGGATWAAQVDVDGATAVTTCNFDVWHDRWTPGDNGTLIHCWWFDTTNDIVRWRTLDTNGDTLGTVRTVFAGASAVAGRGSFVSGTKTRSGYLYCAYDLDAGAERGLHRSTDSGTTWSSSLASTFVEATLDTCKLYPASGTGDDNDCWAIYYDASATALTLKLWDSSAASATESATIGAAHTDGVTDLTGQFGYDACVRFSDGHLILAKVSLRDNASSVHQIFDITDTSTITTKTNITTNIDDHYYPNIFIDQFTNDLYVTYVGKRDGSEVMDTTVKVYYTKSTDGGATWSAGDTAYMEAAAAIVLQAWTPMMGNRFCAVWRVAGTASTNKVNSVILLNIGGQTITAGSTLSSAHTVAVVDPIAGAHLSSAAVLYEGAVVRDPAPSRTAPPISPGILVDYYDQSRVYEGADDSAVALAYTGADYGQSFTLSAPFSAIEVVLWSSDSPAADGTLVLTVTLDDPDGAVVATASRAAADFILATNFSWQLARFTFATIDPGGSPTTYCWVLTSSGQTTGAVWIHYVYPEIAGADSSYWGPAPSWFEDPDSTFLTRVLGETVFPGSVALGGAPDQPVTGDTIASGSSLSSAHALTYTLTGDTIASGASLTAAHTVTVDQAVTGTTIASGEQLFAGTAASDQPVTGTTLGTTVSLFSGTVTVAIGGETIASGAQLFAGTLVVELTIGGDTIASGATLFGGAVAINASGATIASTAALFSGIVGSDLPVSGATIASTAAVFPGVASYAQEVTGATIASGVVLYPGWAYFTGADQPVDGATISGGEVFPGAVSSEINGETIASAAVLYPGEAVAGDAELLGATIGPGSLLYPGSVSVLLEDGELACAGALPIDSDLQF